jgi:hypothetical protein
MSCGYHSRHWFTVYGNPGLRSPVCRRCGKPNPKPLTDSEQREYDYWRVSVGDYRTT